MSSYATKSLRVTFTLNGSNATFAGTGSNQLVLTGLRTVAVLTGMLQYLLQLDLMVYGMAQADMNALSVLRGPIQSPAAITNSTVLLEVNPGNGVWSRLFQGNILHATPEYRGQPEVFFHAQAIVGGYFAGVGLTEAISLPSGASVASIAKIIATSMNLAFNNQGVTGMVNAGTYLCGSPLAQLEKLQENSGQFDWTIDGDGTLVITPKNQPRKNPVITLTPQSGLIGYPTIEETGIAVVALFNPALTLSGRFTISGSDIPAANGDWMPYRVQHQLESVKFGGQWFTSMDCFQVAPVGA